jgi:hypothetical protein
MDYIMLEAVHCGHWTMDPMNIIGKCADDMKSVTIFTENSFS